MSPKLIPLAGTHLEFQIMTSLQGYTKPIKTKHLASRLNIDRVDLVASLNSLRKKKVVEFVKIEDQRYKNSIGRNILNYGWVLCR